MNELETLREYIRNHLRAIKAEQKKQALQEKIQEYRLRKSIRKMLKEAEDIVSHESTGINVLADLLETIVPILKSFYKKLGTDIEQRKSFRAHIIKSVQNMLAPIEMMFSAGGTAGDPLTTHAAQVAAGEKPTGDNKGELEEKVKVTTGGEDGPETDPAFIPLKSDKKEKEQEEKPQKAAPEDTFVQIPGEDETGRNIALQSFKRVEKQIREAYSILANEEDRELFYDYLITNLKLYFDKFEDELQSSVPEPTTPEYEEEKKKKEAEISLGDTETAEAAPEI